MARDPWRERERGSLVLGLALRCADRAGGLLRALGVAPAPFRELLRMRIALDLRPGKGLDKVNLPILLAFTWLAGILPGAAAFLVDDPFTWALLELSITSFLLGMILLLQLGNLLLDGTDLHVIGPLPVSERTLYAARFAHALVYVGLVAACLHGWPLFLSAFGVVPWAPVALVPAAVLATVFTVAAVALLYALLLRVFGPERFQRVTLWTQIGISAFAMGGIHLVNRMITVPAITGFLEGHPGLLALLPTTWFAGVFGVLAGDASTRNLLLSLAAVAAPVLAAFLAFRLASRDLIAGLTAAQGGRDRRGPWAPTPTRRLGARIARTRTERAGFDWALALSRREPAFLRTAYAQVFGLSMMAFSFAFLFGRDGGVFAVGVVPFTAYVLPLLVPTVLELGGYSEDPAAIRSLRALPIDAPGRFHAGAVKALLAGTVLPAYLAIGGFALALSAFSGPWAVASACTALGAAAWLGLATARRMALALPFSRKQLHSRANTANLHVVLGVSLAVGLCLGLHALVALLAPPLFAGAALAMAFLVVREYRALDASLCARLAREDDALLPEVA